MPETAEEQAIKPRRHKTDAELDITPMIDIVFLLLAFFVVSSKMNQATPIKLPQAKHGKGVVAEDAIVLNIKSAGEEIAVTGGIRSEKSFTTTGDDLLDEIEAYVRAESEAKAEGLKAILIKCEGTVTNGKVGPVFVAAKKGVPEHIDIKTAIEEKK